MSTTTALRPKLAKCLGLLGSEHPNEVLAAAKQAERLRREAGLSWSDLIAPPARSPGAAPTPPDWRRALAVCRAHANRLSSWENEFVMTIAAYRSDPSERQREILTKLAAKVSPEA